METDTLKQAENILTFARETKTLLADMLKRRVDDYNGCMKHINDMERELCQDRIIEAIDELFVYETDEAQEITNTYNAQEARLFENDNRTHRGNI